MFFLPGMRLPNQTLSEMVLACLLVTCTNPVTNRYSVLWVMVISSRGRWK